MTYRLIDRCRAEGCNAKSRFGEYCSNHYPKQSSLSRYRVRAMVSTYPDPDDMTTWPVIVDTRDERVIAACPSTGVAMAVAFRMNQR